MADPCASPLLLEPAEFPMACRSQCAILGCDTFDAEANHSKCYFKTCGAFSDIKYSDAVWAWGAHFSGRPGAADHPGR